MGRGCRWEKEMSVQDEGKGDKKWQGLGEWDERGEKKGRRK